MIRLLTTTAMLLGLLTLASADITEQNLGNATFNWNLPTTAGTAGQCLVSQGGGSTSMTWGACSAGTTFTAGYFYATYGGI